VTQAGRWLIDSEGRVLLFHGLNEVAKRPPYAPGAFGFDEADAKWMASEGFRVVRLGVLFSGLMPSPGKVSTSYLEEIAASVDILARNHIFTLLDFHQDGFGPAVGSDGFPPWMTLTNGAKQVKAPFPLYYIEDPAIEAAFQSLWDNAPGPGGIGLQQYAVEGYQAVARRFAHDPWVIGYDVLNEPWPGTTFEPCLAPSGCPSLVESELVPFYRRVVQAVREAGSHQIVFEEPFVLFNFGTSEPDLPRPPGTGPFGMSFHMYTLTPAAEPKLLANALGWAYSTGGALLDTEWDSTSGASGVLRQSAELAHDLIPWLYWSFAGCSAGCAPIGKGAAVIGSLGYPPKGANLNEAIASSLVQPYPLAIAGTPERYSYDPTSRVLELAYATRRAGGGRFARGTTTVLETPRSVYADGYTVRISGASVASPPCSPLLELLAIPGASRVSLRVSPGGRCR
jgi:endoglycosylceramidase